MPFLFLAANAIIYYLLVDRERLSISVVKSDKFRFVNFPPKHGEVVTSDCQVPVRSGTCWRASGSSDVGGCWRISLLGE